MQPQITAKGVERTTARLYVLGRKANDPRPAWENIATDFYDTESEWFGSKGEGSWPNVADATKERWPEHGPFPLVLTGALKASLTNRSPDSVYKPTKLQLRLGTKLHYARFVAGRRPPIKVTPAEADRWRAIIQAHLMDRT